MSCTKSSLQILIRYGYPSNVSLQPFDLRPSVIICTLITRLQPAVHACIHVEMKYFFLYFQLTELSLSPRSPPLLEHQRADADKNRLCVNRRTQERRAHCNNKFVNLLWSSSVMVFVSVYQVPTLLPFLWAISEVQQNTGASSAQSFSKVSCLCVSVV